MKMKTYHSNKGHEHSPGHSYKSLLLMLLVSYAVMYILMYAMVDKWNNVVFNVNQFYMAGLMTTAMLLIELLLMRRMYTDTKLNILLIGAGTISMLAFYSGIRTQSLSGDEQFLKSMIPHHAAAILMVEQTNIQDPEIKKLGEEIISAQKREIDFMKKKLRELKEE